MTDQKVDPMTITHTSYPKTISRGSRPPWDVSYTCTLEPSPRR